MNRRFALQRLCAGVAAGGLFPPFAFADEPLAEGDVEAGEQTPLAPKVEFKTSDEVLAVLDDWEQHSQRINKLSITFQRYVYDTTFLVEKRAEGKLWFEAPDKQRIDIRPMNIAGLPIDEKTRRPYNPLKKGAPGQFYAVQADASSRWISRGDVLLYVDDDLKTYESIEIPPNLRGKTIDDVPWGWCFPNPLAFLFGPKVIRSQGSPFPPDVRVNASRWRERYFIAIGSQHNLDPTAGEARMIHLVAAPRLESIAKQLSRLEVLIDPQLDKRNGENEAIWLPKAIKLLDPAGNQETVYVYSTTDAKLDKNWHPDPFNDPALLMGYKNLGFHRQAS